VLIDGLHAQTTLAYIFQILEYESVTKRLSETEFWVLVSLAGGRRHGYAVLSEVEQLSQGLVRIRMATLYAALEQLASRELIEPAGEEEVLGRTRRYYRLTSGGRTKLSAAAAQRAAAAKTAETRLRTSARPAVTI